MSLAERIGEAAAKLAYFGDMLAESKLSEWRLFINITPRRGPAVFGELGALTEAAGLLPAAGAVL